MTSRDPVFTAPGATPVPGPAYLEGARFIDAAHPAVLAFVDGVVRGEVNPIARATRLFYAVRDGWRYDPFSMRLDHRQYVASNVLETRAAYCIPKAILLAAAARAAGIPAAIGLSDVVNHLTTDKLRDRLGGTDYFMHHGYAVLYLDGQWIKAAPAFNIELCTRFGVSPTEFDGRGHAIFQPYDRQSRRHMEYVKDHGIWSDFPYEKVMDDFCAFYPPRAFGDDTDRFEDGASTSDQEPGRVRG
jgi:transglutaminase-like putative cysteine protease